MSSQEKPLRWTESDRLAALARYAILDTAPEPSFDKIVQMMALILQVPIAAINLIASNRQWFKSEIGLGVREMPLDNSICAKIMLDPDNTIVRDTLEDPRFKCNPLVTGAPGLRFYAGALLVTADGFPLGTLCALDVKPRPEGLTGEQQFMLETLAEQVMTQLELRRAIMQREDILVEQHRTHTLNRQILNSAIDYAIISMDLQGKVLSWNSGAQNVLGWTEEDMLGQLTERIFLPEDIAADAPLKEREIALRDGCAMDERWHVRKSGEQFWAAGELTPLKNDQQEVVGFVKVLRDRTEQKRIEADLQHLNQTLESQVAERTRERDQLWRNSQDIFLILNVDGVVQAVNPAWTTILGHKQEELVGHSFQIFLHPDDVAPSDTALAKAMQQPLANFENRYRHKDGSYRWLAWIAVPEDGRVFANARDITNEKKQAQQLLMANETRLRLALDAGKMGAWQWDIVQDEVLWMHGSAQLHGQPPTVAAKFKLSSYFDYVHVADREHVKNVLRQTIAQGNNLYMEYRIVWPDQSVHWAEAQGKFLDNEAGHPREMVGVTTDITHRKVTEQNLRFLAQASAQLASLYDPQSTLNKVASLAVPCFADWCVVDLLDDDNTLNRVAVAHVDPEKTQLVRELQRRFPPEKDAPHGAWNIIRTGQPELITEISDEILEQSIKNDEYRAALKTLRIKSYIAAPLLSHGKVLGVISFVGAESGRVFNQDDLSLAQDLARRAGIAIENAHLYQALQQSDRGKDVFLATLAHELRNPLAAIANAVSIIKLAADDKKRVEQATKISERQVRHLTRLVDDLMDISRIATGKIELRKEPTSLQNILNNAIESSRAQIQMMQHKLSVTLPGVPTEIEADPVRLTQVFANLLHNAAKYTNAGGKIDVVLESADHEYIVRVKDTGIGIPAEKLKDIFTIFAQIEHPLERSGGGLGIGLSLVEGLVKMHGGRVEAFSAGTNAGSEFVVRLPKPPASTSNADVNTQKGAESTMPVSNSKRILVVDDNVDAASMLTEILQILGNEVVGMVHDGLAGVEATARMKPDMVLLDIGLPNIDGYEVAQRIRAQEALKQVVLVALTGWGHEKDKQRAQQAGFDHYLIKPVKLEELQDILARD
jgi:PAS domain S-box-containing protein